VDEVELTPEQPPQVAAAIAAMVVAAPPEPDPWWLAGLRDALDT
jgi:hypothetical protein